MKRLCSERKELKMQFWTENILAISIITKTLFSQNHFYPQNPLNNYVPKHYAAKAFKALYYVDRVSWIWKRPISITYNNNINFTWYYREKRKALCGIGRVRSRRNHRATVSITKVSYEVPERWNQVRNLVNGSPKR